MGVEELLLYTANKTVEACVDWVSALYSHLARVVNSLSIQRKVTHTNHNVGPAWSEITTFPLHCKIEKSEGDRTRTYQQVTQKNSATEAWKALRCTLT